MLNEFLEKNDAPSSSNENYDSLFELVADEDRKKYVCKSAGCGKFFRYKSEIIRHTATHSESRPFICQYENCQKAFKRNDALENHIRSSHTKETPFTCPVQECGLKFTTHGSFRYHVLKHNKQLSEEEILAASKEEDLFDMPQATKQIKIGEMADNVSTLGCQPPSRDAAYQKFDKNNYEEFFTPPPKFAGKIKWEMVSEETECTSPCQKKEDTPHDNYTAVLEENKILKDKLSTSQKVIQTMQTQINDLLNNLFVCQSQLGNLSNPIHLTGYNQQEPFQRPGGFPMQNNFPVQSNFPVNMLNYGKNMTGKPAETQFNTESTISSNSVDRFLSFGKESNSFNF